MLRLRPKARPPPTRAAEALAAPAAEAAMAVVPRANVAPLNSAYFPAGSAATEVVRRVPAADGPERGALQAEAGLEQELDVTDLE